MSTYRVRYEQDEAGYWVAHAVGVQGCHTQARNLETARERIREALAVCVDNAEDASLDESFDIKRKPALKVAARARSAKRRADAANDEAQELLRDAVRQLLAANLSHRDAAVVLGISHQRVAQLSQPTPRQRKGA